MEELEEINQGEKNLCLEEMCNQIQVIGKWYKFFAILSIIGACFMVICGIFLVVIGTLAMSNPMFYFIDDAAITYLIAGPIYIILAGIYIPVIVYLMRAAKIAKNIGYSKEESLMVNFLNNTRKYWKYWGIVTIVALILFVVIFIGLIVIVAFI